MARSRSLWGRCKLAWRAFNVPLMRQAMPLNTGTKNVMPDETTKIEATWQGRDPWRPERLFVSAADVGGEGSAANWTLIDVLIDGRSQFAQSGALPGDMFGAQAIDSFVTFGKVERGSKIVVVVKYGGKTTDGTPFYGSFVGTEVDDTPLTVLCELVVDGLRRLARLAGAGL